MKKLTRREFVASAVAASAVAGAGDAVAAQQQRPNVLYIMADDLGWGDLSCYGRPDYKTPNLDRLAAEGLRFTQAYSAAPVCTPTRCAFVTGRYPARTAVGLEEPLSWRSTLVTQKRDVGLPPEYPTVASLLKAAGYRTALVGKWHLGYLPKYSPLKSGFEEFFGIMSGGADYFTHKDATGEADLFEAEVPVERVGYMTDLLTERAVEYLRSRRDAPFFLSLNYTAPHWPWEGPRDESFSRSLKGGYGGFTSGGSLKVYAEMMRSLDSGIGRVLGALEDGAKRAARLSSLRATTAASASPTTGPSRVRSSTCERAAYASPPSSAGRASSPRGARPSRSPSRWTGRPPSSPRPARARTPTTRSTARTSCPLCAACVRPSSGRSSGATRFRRRRARGVGSI